MDVTLEKIDIIRERTGVSVRKAREALQRAGGDVVEALILIEEEQANPIGAWQERIQVRGQEWLERLKQLIREGNVTKVIVRHDDQTLLEIPVTAGVIGALLMPTLAAVGVVAAMVTGATIVVERRGPARGTVPAGTGAPGAVGRGPAAEQAWREDWPAGHPTGAAGGHPDDAAGVPTPGEPGGGTAGVARG